ncbi:MAG TPA: DUF3500 domain-containing protein [Pirellulales bacterium]|nr:DUF3500 domain-containing protein [Pirellulales bacterium]
MMLMRKPFAALVLLLVASSAAFGLLNFRPAGADMTQAAQQFLADLSERQQAQAMMGFDDPARLDWHYIPKDKRKGLQIKDMDPQLRKRAHALLASGVSALGYEKAVTIMSLEEILRELEKERKGAPLRDPERYYFTVFGKPSATGRWGWSVEGHHLSLNFVVDGGQVASATPAFYGANPAEVKTELNFGPKKGTRVLRDEEELAFKLLRSLSDEQRQTAILADKAPADIRAAGQPHAPNTPPEGLAAEKLQPDQVETLRALLRAYTDKMPAETAEARLVEVRDAGIEKVFFAWAGADKPGLGHSYRVQGPTFVIEFNNTQPDASGNLANHIHAVWRQMAGDFGLSRKDKD